MIGIAPNVEIGNEAMSIFLLPARSPAATPAGLAMITYPSNPAAYNVAINEIAEVYLCGGHSTGIKCTIRALAGAQPLHPRYNSIDISTPSENEKEV